MKHHWVHLQDNSDGTGASCADPEYTTTAKNQQDPPCAALRMLIKRKKPSHTFLMESHELRGRRKRRFHIGAENSPKKVLNVTVKRWKCLKKLKKDSEIKGKARISTITKPTKTTG